MWRASVTEAHHLSIMNTRNSLSSKWKELRSPCTFHHPSEAALNLATKWDKTKGNQSVQQKGNSEILKPKKKAMGSFRTSTGSPHNKTRKGTETLALPGRVQ